MPADQPAPVLIRRADRSESDELAALMHRVRVDNVPAIPAPVHDLDDMRRWMREVVFEHHDVWAGDCDGRIVGMLVLAHPDWIEHLYVDSSYTGRGLGARFVELARHELPGDIQLWTFETNLGARRFYEREGFVAVETTEGDNEENAPDIRFVWHRP